MALDAGSVSIDPTTGAVSGSGYARALYDLEAEAQPYLGGDLDAAVDTYAATAAENAADPAWWTLPATLAAIRTQLLALRQKTAPKCHGQAAALVALVQTGTVVVPPGGAGGTFPVL